MHRVGWPLRLAVPPGLQDALDLLAGERRALATLEPRGSAVLEAEGGRKDGDAHCCLHEVGPGCHPTFRIDGTISLLEFPLASLVWKAF